MKVMKEGWMDICMYVCWYLVGMVGALGYNLAALAGHEVEQLVDEEGGGEGLDPAPRNCD